VDGLRKNKKGKDNEMGVLGGILGERYQSSAVLA
jgi:hypothetical protein